MNSVDEKKYTIDELVERTKSSRRTIRYYVQEGLLEPPAGRGRGGFYYDSHLTRLLAIRALQDKGMRLSAIAGYLQGQEGAEERTQKSMSLAVPQRRLWARYELAPWLTLEVRRDAEEEQSQIVDDIIRIIQQVLEERK
ncbi:MAG: MerR family transcriptional regulator [Acidobacteriota bacterium]|nr:MAG: MerR family transcriptional regulator [Acidobacteriota bacterium]